jgi:hypothetical protein
VCYTALKNTFSAWADHEAHTSDMPALESCHSIDCEDSAQPLNITSTSDHVQPDSILMVLHAYQCKVVMIGMTPSHPLSTVSRKYVVAWQ